MNKISEIWDRTIGIEGVDTGYPKFEKELLVEMGKVREEAEQTGWAKAMTTVKTLMSYGTPEEAERYLTNPKGDTE